jgi:hypothetical protein
LKRQTTTDGEGFFTAPVLPPGIYSLRVQREGFSPVEINSIVPLCRQSETGRGRSSRHSIRSQTRLLSEVESRPAPVRMSRSYSLRGRDQQTAHEEAGSRKRRIGCPSCSPRILVRLLLFRPGRLRIKP